MEAERGEEGMGRGLTDKFGTEGSRSGSEGETRQEPHTEKWDWEEMK